MDVGALKEIKELLIGHIEQADNRAGVYEKLSYGVSKLLASQFEAILERVEEIESKYGKSESTHSR